MFHSKRNVSPEAARDRPNPLQRTGIMNEAKVRDRRIYIHRSGPVFGLARSCWRLLGPNRCRCTKSRPLRSPEFIHIHRLGPEASSKTESGRKLAQTGVYVYPPVPQKPQQFKDPYVLLLLRRQLKQTELLTKSRRRVGVCKPL